MRQILVSKSSRLKARVLQSLRVRLHMSKRKNAGEMAHRRTVFLRGLLKNGGRPSSR